MQFRLSGRAERQSGDMPRPARKAFAGAKYHITVRGNGRQNIFLGDKDRQRFLEQLWIGLEKDGVILYAYVLMSNHYHLLIETRQGNVSAFMQRLNTAYGMYFRYKHGRPGHALQGRFGGKLVEGDDYLARLTRYVHLNPVKVKAAKDLTGDQRRALLRGYRWSSYRGYVEAGAEEPWVDYRWRALAGGRSAKEKRARYRRYVEGFIATDDEMMKEAFGRSEYAVGDDAFVARVEGEMRAGRTRGGAVHDVALPAEAKVPLDAVDGAVCRVFGCQPGRLRAHGRVAGVAKGVAIEAACRLGPRRQRAVGQHYGLSGAAIGYQRRKVVARLNEDRELANRLDTVLRLAQEAVT